MVKYGKIFGERNSGTNFVLNLLSTNCAIQLLGNTTRLTEIEQTELKTLPIGLRVVYRERILDRNHFRDFGKNLGWKHACVSGEVIRVVPIAEQTAFLFMVRHPAFWISSMFRRPHHAFMPPPKTLEEFITTPWLTTRRDCCEQVLLPSPLDLWNHKVGSYLSASRQLAKAVIIRHEDIARDFKTIFKPIEDLGIEVRSKQNFTANANIKEKEKTYEYYQAQVQKDPRTTVSETALRLIRERINPATAAALDYAL